MVEFPSVSVEGRRQRGGRRRRAVGRRGGIGGAGRVRRAGRADPPGRPAMEVLEPAPVSRMFRAAHGCAMLCIDGEFRYIATQIRDCNRL
ncbi:hypothetical protein C6V06_04020 [Burkholderia gladioli]|nr:hypothetical protein [Burkholderia gladioli]NBI45355.1 hypothetical protein [Burkholderia sp. ISTR5]PRE17750.1 hypothetical protein C6P72_22415 [Burkholderia gladioli]PRG57066.1 hypothetical protein C6V06_04020 [Burkholderia gladioli]PRG92836.1 hypothetical protein C6V08_28320 [Burkholderia gladioli]